MIRKNSFKIIMLLAMMLVISGCSGGNVVVETGEQRNNVVDNKPFFTMDVPIANIEQPQGPGSVQIELNYKLRQLNLNSDYSGELPLYMAILDIQGRVIKEAYDLVETPISANRPVDHTIKFDLSESEFKNYCNTQLTVVSNLNPQKSSLPESSYFIAPSDANMKKVVSDAPEFVTVSEATGFQTAGTLKRYTSEFRLVCNEQKGELDGLYGDVNNDGVLNYNDIAAIENFIADGWSDISTELLRRADVTGNGQILMEDLELLRDYFNGVIDVFPVGKPAPRG
jgi:hypothetical protein